MEPGLELTEREWSHETRALRLQTYIHVHFKTLIQPLTPKQ